MTSTEPESGLTPEEEAELRELAQEVIEVENQQMQAVAENAINQHRQNRLIALGVELRRADRRIQELEQEVSNLKDELSQVKSKSTPPKKSSSRKPGSVTPINK